MDKGKKRARPVVVPLPPPATTMPPPNFIPHRNSTSIAQPVLSIIRPPTSPFSDISPKKKKAKNTPIQKTDKRKRNLAAQLAETFGDANALERNADELDMYHLRPIARTTEKDYRYALTYHSRQAIRLFIEFMTFKHNGDVNKAQDMVKQNAPFPPIKYVKAFLHFLATTGTSALGIEGVSGWSLNTVRIFKNRFCAAVKRETGGSGQPSKEETEQLSNYINDLAKKQKGITTKRREKKSIREQDLEDIINTLMDPSFVFRDIFQKLELHAYISILYNEGQQPGTIVEGRTYKGTNQCLLWKDIRAFVVGWSDEGGPEVQLLLQWRHNKFMRDMEEMETRSNMHTLPVNKSHLDGVLSILAMGSYLDVWVDNIHDLLSSRNNIKLFPHAIRIKPEAQHKAVFVQGKGEASTYGSMHNFFQRLKAVSGYDNLSARMFRYAFAGQMVGKMPDHHVRYLMGHVSRSKLAKFTYQTPDRAIDVTATRWGTTAHTETAEYASSVAYNHNKDAHSRPSHTADDRVIAHLKTDGVILQLLEEHARACDEVEKCHGVDPQTASEKFNSTEVQEMDELWQDVLARYKQILSSLDPLSEQFAFPSLPDFTGCIPMDTLDNSIQQSLDASAYFPDLSDPFNNISWPSDNVSSDASKSLFGSHNFSVQPMDMDSNLGDLAQSLLGSGNSSAQSINSPSGDLALFSFDSMQFSSLASSSSDLSANLPSPFQSEGPSFDFSGEISASMIIASPATMTSDPIAFPATTTSDSTSPIDEKRKTDLLHLANQYSTVFSHMPPALLAMYSNLPLGRLVILKHYKAIIDSGKLMRQRICPFCFTNPDKTPEQKQKIWSGVSWVDHLHSCEEARYQSSLIRCSMCHKMIPIAVDDEDDPHFDECFSQWLERTRLEQRVVDESDDTYEVASRSEDALPSSSIIKPAWKNGLDNTSVNIPRLGSQNLKGKRCYLCPVCIFDANWRWTRVNGRLFTTADRKVAACHILTHTHRSTTNLFDLRQNKRMECPFPDCIISESMNVPHWINHMEHHHGYSFLIAMKQDSESAESIEESPVTLLSLPTDSIFLSSECIMYETYAEGYVETSGESMSKVCVIDFQTKSARLVRKENGRQAGKRAAVIRNGQH
ncbi:hypothetical protein EW146_g2122 [Bondarzewia mesenterica]|uniref:Uncharacterized protein n=1 Tax=Bondarzewia mesenterica TaxID=1095465 RepID=A0A4S4M3Y5_9AGAM|nr:hypothetical protein EW146_g2122 [Bondarzewia mesenterica]